MRRKRTFFLLWTSRSIPKILLIIVGLVAGLFNTQPTNAQSPNELAFARQILTDLQDNSFAANREYCGIIGIDEDNRLVASRPRKGSRGSCTPRDPRNVVDIIASYHTHAGFDESYDSEVPSSDDVLGDMEEGLDGYIATPGGRFWFVDGQSGSARQICGIACLPQDPDFEANIYGPIKQRYSLGELERRESE